MVCHNDLACTFISHNNNGILAVRCGVNLRVVHTKKFAPEIISRWDTPFLLIFKTYAVIIYLCGIISSSSRRIMLFKDTMHHLCGYIVITDRHPFDLTSTADTTKY